MHKQAATVTQSDCLFVRSSARMGGTTRGPRVSSQAIVYAKVADLIAKHPPTALSYNPLFLTGVQGKWVKGVVVESVARSGKGQTLWAINFVGHPHTLTVFRSVFQTTAPPVPQDAIMTSAIDNVGPVAPVVLAQALPQALAQAPGQAPAPTVPAPTSGALPVEHDYVMAGTTTWDFRPIGTTDECRPKLLDPDDRRADFMGAEPVVFSEKLRGLTHELKNVAPESKEKWDLLLEMFWPGYMADQLEKMNLAANTYKMSRMLAARPVTKPELLSVIQLLVDGTLRTGKSVGTHFKASKPGGRTTHPDMSDTIPLARFREILKVLPFSFADESCMRHAMTETNDKYGWGMFHKLLTDGAMSRAELIECWVYDKVSIPASGCRSE